MDVGQRKDRMKSLAEEMAQVLLLDQKFREAQPAERPGVALRIVEAKRDDIVNAFLAIFREEAFTQGLTKPMALASVDCCMVLGSVIAAAKIDTGSVQEHMVASVITIHEALTAHGIEPADIGDCTPDHAFKSASAMLLVCAEASCAFTLAPLILAFARAFTKGGLQ